MSPQTKEEDRISENEVVLERICFSDEATFHVSEKLNKHNVKIWGSEHPHKIEEFQRGGPKVNVRCGMMCNQIIGPFFFLEAANNADVYFDLLTEYAAPQLIDVQPTIIFQRDSAPPHWILRVHHFLNKTFPDQCSGRDRPISWPSRSPDIIPLDFFLWGYVKDIVYRTKVRDITELKQRISDAIDTIDEAMLQRT